MASEEASTSAVNNTAPIKWAQRSDSLYLTIALPGKCVVDKCALCSARMVSL
jgi:hypothetical protein